MQEGNVESLIFEAALRLHESLDPGEIVANSIELLPGIVQAESWAVFLKAEQADRLELVRAVNATLLPVGPFIEIEPSPNPLVQAVIERRTIVTRTPQEGAQPGQHLVGGGQSSLCIPLVARERLIGAVQATRRLYDNDAAPGDFSEKEAGAATLVCHSMSTALANAFDYLNATRQTLIDDLTRLYNVRYLYQTLDNEIRRARRYGSAASVVFMDLDGFKMVNDIYGHRAGSVTLTEVAEVITLSVREADFVARYGGDEFVLMLPETPAERALQVAERVRSQIAGHRFTGGVGAEIYLTASFGVASFPEHAAEAEKLIELADAAMYEAKQHNKNNVWLSAS